MVVGTNLWLGNKFMVMGTKSIVVGTNIWLLEQIYGFGTNL
jgi:hypothetical protein